MYKGSRLHDLCLAQRGLSTQLSLALFGKKKGIDRYYHDGINITIDMLEKIAMNTGKSVDYFLEYKHTSDGLKESSSVNGNNNIVNSPMANEAMAKIDHLNEVIKLKDDLIVRDKQLIETKDVVIKSLRDTINDYIKLLQASHSDNTRT
ncbi:MAG: hypothetical protein LKE54_03580 [Prevotella sp.]|jgi:plasmid maintenance system antidote protein VapI|nr:hypothetical protein [Prevotella sp.]MCH3994127.1 hypothetical protein [Prevotella sp.]